MMQLSSRERLLRALRRETPDYVPCCFMSFTALRRRCHEDLYELVKAERAIGLEPDFFEAHFNLGNIYHDLGRLEEAIICYREAVKLNATYADAHFYLAVACEKIGLSQEARPHWKAYQRLAPDGEWVELAKEFSGD